MNISQTLLFLSIAALPILLAITLHEAAHGFVADKCGDDTAKAQGRLSLNPLVHVDPVGTIIMPLILLLLPGNFLFGYAKPVPVNVSRLNNPKRDMIWVAAAGPAINFVLALVSALLFFIIVRLVPTNTFTQWAANTLNYSIFFNCLIGIFNLLPIPPLDGGRILTGLLPMPLAARYAGLERFGLMIVLGLFILVPLLIGINLFVPLVLQPTLALSQFFKTLVGF